MGSGPMGRRATLTAVLLIVTAAVVCGGRAEARVYYTVNGRPAPPAVARYMVGNGLRPGHYWLSANGYWGVVGNPIPLGNINVAGNRVQDCHSEACCTVQERF